MEKKGNTLTIVLVVLFIAVVLYIAFLYFAKQTTPDSKSTENGEKSETPALKADLIRVDTPLPNEILRSPFTVRGEARGYWYFEASFPVKLLSETGEVIAMGIAQAQSEWMTEDYVPFSVTLEFDPAKAGKTGTLLLEKDNPSGLPEYADELRFPVKFQ